MEAVEEREGGKVGPDKVKFLGMSYKGVVQPAVVREMGKMEKEERVSDFGRCVYGVAMGYRCLIVCAERGEEGERES